MWLYLTGQLSLLVYTFDSSGIILLFKEHVVLLLVVSINAQFELGFQSLANRGFAQV